MKTLIKKIDWRYAFVLLFIITMTCGYFGFREANSALKEYSALDAIYQTLQLFVLNFNKIPANSGLLDIARIAAIFIMIFTAYKAVDLLVNDGLYEIKHFLINDHVVICGMGLTGDSIYNYLKDKKNKSFILIDSKSESPFYGKQSFNTLFIKGDASSQQVIRQMKLKKVKYLYITTGEDFINIKILNEILNINRETPFSMNVYVRTEDDRVKDSVNKALEDLMYSKDRNEYFKKDGSGIKIKVDNISSFAIKKLKDKICSKKNNIVVFGCGNIGKKIVYTALENITHENTKITIIEQSRMTKEYHKNIINRKYNVKKNNGLIYEFHCQNALLLDLQDIREIITETPDIIFVCLGGNWANIKVALLLRELYNDDETKTEIIIISSDTAFSNNENHLFLLENNKIDVYHLQQNAVEVMCSK
jgi:hypothetical protein